MEKWKCKYCNNEYVYVRLCVYHEINECKKNPKFKYKNDNIKN